MDRPKPLPPPHVVAERVRAVGLLLATLLTIGLAARATWLLVTSPVQGTAFAVAEQVDERPAHPRQPMAPQRQQRLTADEVAMLGGLCPTALSAVPPEWLPAEPAGGATATGPRGRLTGLRWASRGDGLPSSVESAPGVRVAQAPISAPREDGWLVDPNDWYAPEDAAERLSQPAESPPSSPESTAAEPPEPESPQPPPPTSAPPQPASEQEAEQEEVEQEAEPPVERAAPSEPARPADVAPPIVPVEPPAPVEPPPADELPFESAPPTAPDWRPVIDVPLEPADVPPEPTEEPPSKLVPPQEAIGPSFAPPGVALPEPNGWSEDPKQLDEVLAPPPEEPVDSEEAAEAEAEVEAWEPIEPFKVEAKPPVVEPTPPAPVDVTPHEVARPPIFDSPVEPIAEPAPEPQPEPLADPPTPAPVVPRPEPNPGLPTQPPPKQGLFAPPPASPHGAGASAEARAAAKGKSADESHRELFAKNCYPSARQCAECHQRVYDEWSVSSHAYAFISPMFHRFEEKLTQLSQGTVGHFCYRCHSPIATAMGEARSTPVGDLAEVAREGVTCIVCHRVNQRWGKSNGERRVVPGDIYNPIYGGLGGDGVAKAIAEKDEYKVKTSPDQKGPGQPIHTEGRFFDQLTQAEACTSCHQVAVHPGVKLEVVWEQYRASPACKKGVTCQECHMGRVPGMAGGYNYGPVAELNGKTVNEHRKQSSHIFYGPGYSIAHPGVFPQHKDAAKWTVNEWTLFDWRAGWGTDEFEDRLEEIEDRGVDTSAWFPTVWSEVDDRCDAREIVDDNLERLKTKRRYRELVMENGSHVDGPFFRKTPTVGRDLKFDYVVANKNEGHNLPTASLGAQPQLWANVVLIGPDGRRLWETGYTDSNGDLADIHSVDVRNGRVPFDKQLFNLQTMFLITGATGTDREFPLPVNISFDQVPHLRPGTIPITTTNHPPFIRMEGRSIAPLGKKRVKYTVPGELLCQPGRYRLSFRLRSRTEPMYFMRFCDATPEMLRAMTEGTLDIHPYSVEFDVLP